MKALYICLEFLMMMIAGATLRFAGHRLATDVWIMGAISGAIVLTVITSIILDAKQVDKHE